LADAFVSLFWPWSATTYPGPRRAFGALLQVAPEYARNLMQGRQRLPLKHTRRLVAFLELRIVEEQALLEQLREEVARQERDLAMRPNIGYVNGIHRWRRDQAALKVSKDS
jgi:hypothetical protein